MMSAEVQRIQAGHMADGESITLHVRRFPRELARAVGVEAARKGITKRRLIIGLLSEAFQGDRDSDG